MVQGQPNRLAEMEVFVAAAEHGGFSAAARARAMTPSAVSKLMARLEQRLGTRLFNRSTRKLQLTSEGAAFFDRCTTILAQIDEAERCAGVSEASVGRVRVSVNVPVGTRILLPLIRLFVDRYPRVELDISLTDRVVDLLEERTDVAIRSGPLPDSSLRARKLGTTSMMIVAAPEYLKRFGAPESPSDLEGHARLGFSYTRAIEGWPMRDGAQRLTLPIDGPVQISDGEALRRLVLEGLGMARLAHFQVRDDLATGRLVQVLQEYTHEDSEEIHAVFVGNGGPMPARVRALLDFLADSMDQEAL